MSGIKVLIVDDDAESSRLMARHFGESGFLTGVVASGEDAIDRLRDEPFDLVILDVVLPGMNGFDLCREIRKLRSGNGPALIIVSGRTEEIDRVVGLELGADDYLAKPFSPRELILRARIILRRKLGQTPPDGVWRFGNLTVDEPGRRVLVDNEDVTLTATEFDLLLELVLNRGMALSRERMMGKANLAQDADGRSRTVDTHIRRVRQKLGSCARHIETVRGVGYRFNDSRRAQIEQPRGQDRDRNAAVLQ